MSEYGYFLMLGAIQIVHAQEEIWTGFHKRWFVFTMSRWVFVTFEVLFSLTIIAYVLRPDLPLSHTYMSLFALAMLINGIGHIVWGLVVKKYVPGLITAPFLVAVFAGYYLTLVKI